MPALQTCDQTARGLAYNTTSLSSTLPDGTVVTFTIRWTWDGSSVWPDCDGPLANGSGSGNRWAVQATNTGTVPIYLHTVRRNGSPAVYTLPAGQTATATAAQAAANGFASYADFGDMTLTLAP